MKTTLLQQENINVKQNNTGTFSFIEKVYIWQKKNSIWKKNNSSGKNWNSQKNLIYKIDPFKVSMLRKRLKYYWLVNHSQSELNKDKLSISCTFQLVVIYVYINILYPYFFGKIFIFVGAMPEKRS